MPEDADAVEETDEGVILGEVIPPGDGVGPEGGIGPLIVEQELPNKVVETVARPSEIMVATTRSVTVSMKEAWLVNSTIRILAMTALTGNRDLGSCGKVGDAGNAITGAGCRIDAGVGDSGKRREDLRRRHNLGGRPNSRHLGQCRYLRTYCRHIEQIPRLEGLLEGGSEKGAVARPWRGK